MDSDPLRKAFDQKHKLTEDNMLPYFNARKAAQVAVFFAQRESSNSISVLKLVKLIYLADRMHMQKYDAPITYDEIVAMPHGPVNSTIKRFIDGKVSAREWSEFVHSRRGNYIRATATFTDEDLNELSFAETETLEEVWSTFGSMEPYALRDYTHEFCPEWEDPDGTSIPIPYEKIFRCLGKDDPELLSSQIEQERQVFQHFADCQ